METSIENANASLWKYVTPKSVFENIRVVLSNRLSSSGKEWALHFSIDNSGTYVCMGSVSPHGAVVPLFRGFMLC